MRYLVGLWVSLVAASCTVEPQPINYGEDHCDYCKMTIVDNRYASELVTDKGKVFKFDAVECLINYKAQNTLSAEQISFLLVTDYANPGQLIDASQGFYLRSIKLPSPMGMFITGFSDPEEARTIAAEVRGSVYSWDELLQRFAELPVLTEMRKQDRSH